VAETVDVLVIGGGPAGSTIARLLASWDYSVLLLSRNSPQRDAAGVRVSGAHGDAAASCGLRGPQPRTPMAESLPPGIDNVFELTGIRKEAKAAGFYPARGSTAWWANPEPLVENFAKGSQGYHVDRQSFDQFLLSLAEREGVTVRRNSRAPRVVLDVGAAEHDGGVSSARFIVDASGRAGMLARQIRRFWDSRYRTLALCGVFRATSAWDADPNHTLIEAYDRGWAWSAPLASDRRQVCFMVDSAGVKGGLDPAYHAELDRTIHFRRLFERSILEDTPWGRDAALYYADRYAGSNWLLIGDAASFADPLSSFGIKKAMLSAWTGAVVVNTCLSKPHLADAAIGLHQARESGMWLDHAWKAAQSYGEAAAVFGCPFWQQRAVAPDNSLYRADQLEAAVQRLRRAASVRFRLIANVTCEPRPAIREREVTLETRPVLAGLANTEYLHGVHLAALAKMAPRFTSVGEFYEAYAAENTDTPLADFLTALSLLVVKGVVQVS
jgi:flavin-dependent dehydrogenase